MSPPPEQIEHHELRNEIRKQMELILNYYDGTNTRSLEIQKYLQKLKYLLDLKNTNR